MLTVIVTLLLVGTAIAVLGYVLSLVVNAAAPPMTGLWERRRVARHMQRAQRGDTFLAGGDVDRAVRAWRRAFYLAPLGTRALATTVANHHTALLSRFLAVTADLRGGTVRLLSLAKVDRLLAERSELQSRYVAARQSGRRDRTREALVRLHANAQELAGALVQLEAEVRAARRPPPVQ